MLRETICCNFTSACEFQFVSCDACVAPASITYASICVLSYFVILVIYRGHLFLPSSSVFCQLKQKPTNWLPLTQVLLLAAICKSLMIFKSHPARFHNFELFCKDIYLAENHVITVIIVKQKLKIKTEGCFLVHHTSQAYITLFIFPIREACFFTL